MEKFSVVKVLEVMGASRVTLLLIDAAEGLVDQDLHLLGAALKVGRVNELTGRQRNKRRRLMRFVKRGS